MAATGAQFMMFSTGRGAPQGFPSMPVIKICGNPNTYQRMENDMDLNAGLIITGDKTIEQVGEEAFAKLPARTERRNDQERSHPVFQRH